MSINKNGIDTHYMSKNLYSILTNLGDYGPDELSRVLLRLAKVADEEVFNEPEFCTKTEPIMPEVSVMIRVLLRIDFEDWDQCLNEEERQKLVTDSAKKWAEDFLAG